ncbi:MAG: flagellar hook-length control protein FliK, partial [Trichlorobacter sp.]|uniref:flagellar hook-length control protein FliK n=1 Tax=Trichlorobacter sp. TaxID=2911007 RepID=UPI002566C9F2
PDQHGVTLHTGQQMVNATSGESAEAFKAVPQELVGRQVTDRLVSHEIKQGNDQISFKLSPENLGTLQLNMRMEDNRLKLEIVAENRGVRDALLQQADDLKETLARQNIKVDSFNVTMSSNGNQSQQSQDWRQMMPEQHQQSPSQYASRTNPNSGKIEAPMQYFAPQYQSTLDVRF